MNRSVTTAGSGAAYLKTPNSTRAPVTATVSSASGSRLGRLGARAARRAHVVANPTSQATSARPAIHRTNGPAPQATNARLPARRTGLARTKRRPSSLQRRGVWATARKKSASSDGRNRSRKIESVNSTEQQPVIPIVADPRDPRAAGRQWNPHPIRPWQASATAFDGRCIRLRPSRRDPGALTTGCQSRRRPTGMRRAARSW